VSWTKYSLKHWYRQAGPIFDASLGMEFFGFGLPEVREGVASHREKRRPDFRAAEEAKSCPYLRRTSSPPRPRRCSPHGLTWEQMRDGAPFRTPDGR